MRKIDIVHNNKRLYKIYLGIKQRCYNPKRKEYAGYGAKGIVMCDEWGESYEAFYAWSMANGYDDTLSIDRFPDNSGNYEPFNCRWATTKEQNNNTSKSKYLEHNGVKKTLRQWADFYGVNYHTFYDRLFVQGLDIETAGGLKKFNNPHERRVNMIDKSGNTIKTYNSIKEAESELGLHKGSVSKTCRGEFRHTKGYRFEYA